MSDASMFWLGFQNFYKFFSSTNSDCNCFLQFIYDQNLDIVVTGELQNSAGPSLNPL